MLQHIFKNMNWKKKNAFDSRLIVNETRHENIQRFVSLVFVHYDQRTMIYVHQTLFDNVFLFASSSFILI